MLRAVSSQLRTSAPLWPQTWHVKSGSRSDSRTSVRPSVRAHRGPVTALVVRAINQGTANARGAHFSERDLLLAAGLGKAHDCANRAGSEAVGYWGLV